VVVSRSHGNGFARTQDFRRALLLKADRRRNYSRYQITGQAVAVQWLNVSGGKFPLPAGMRLSAEFVEDQRTVLNICSRPCSR
jgi:hypothetical protein